MLSSPHYPAPSLFHLVPLSFDPHSEILAGSDSISSQQETDSLGVIISSPFIEHQLVPAISLSVLCNSCHHSRQLSSFHLSCSQGALVSRRGTVSCCLKLHKRWGVGREGGARGAGTSLSCTLGASGRVMFILATVDIFPLHV